MANIVNFGGAGFIGSHLCKKLLSNSHNVICIDDFSSGYFDNIRSINCNEKFKYIKCDITDKACLEKYKIFEWADVVFNQAASKKNICLKDPHRDLDVNGGGTLTLLQLAHEYGIKKFIHASTGSVYGEVKGTTTEQTRLNPVSYYGVSKLAGERYVNMYHEQFGLDTTILRYFHVYGSKQESKDDLGGVISIFARRIREGLPLVVYGSGEQVRSFTHVDDIVKANIESMEKGSGEVFNVASGVKITINELIEKMFKYFGKRVEVQYKDWLVGDVLNFDIDNSKIEKHLDIDFKKQLDLGGI